jgi:hypothetical protein
MGPGSSVPGPYPYPPMSRPPGMLPMHPLPHMNGHPPPGHPMHGAPTHPSGQPGHPLGPPPPPNKSRAPKKPKQALGAAFSRAPLIRPGLGGVPAKSNGTGEGSGSKPSEVIMRGRHFARMAAQASKDELSGRVPPGTAVLAATGGWGMGGFAPPPRPGANKAPFPVMPTPVRPAAGTKLSVILSKPPAEALPPSMSEKAASPSGENELKKEDEDEDTPDSPTTSTKPNMTPRPPITLPPIFFHNNTVYLSPDAYPKLGEDDLKKMSALSFGEAMNYLATHCAKDSQDSPLVAPSGASTSTAADNAEDKADEAEEDMASPAAEDQETKVAS